MTKRRTALAAALLLAMLAVAALVGFAASGSSSAAREIGAGDYRLQTTDGGSFTADTLAGRPTLVFFGFTHCPDVCPTTMAEIAGWYEALGEEAGDLRSYFVTVDPERDTAEHLKSYVSWTGRVVGVTGSRAETDKAIEAFGIYAAKVPGEDGGYSMDHTASVFLFDRTGALAGTIPYMEDRDVALGKLRDILRG